MSENNHKPFVLNVLPERVFHIYIDAKGGHYLPDASERFEPIEDAPDDVGEFVFHIKHLTAAESRIGTNQVVERIKQERRKGRRNQGTIDAIAAEESQKAMDDQFIRSLVYWNWQTDEGEPVDISHENIERLPGWVYAEMRDAYSEVNEASKN